MAEKKKGFFDYLGDFVSDLPIIGEFTGDTTSSLSEDQQKRYEQLRQNYLDQLGPNRQARMQALQQTMSLFQPMADTMQRHTGQQYDFSGLFQDPMRNFDSAIQDARNERDRKHRAGQLVNQLNELNPTLSKNGRSPITRLNSALNPEYDVTQLSDKVRYNSETGQWELK